jgi:hypothetical protein
MKEGLIKDTYELIIKEIQTIITLLYLLAVGIGMLFNHQKYSEFDINIFEYSDVFDFLIAPFADFNIFLFALASSTVMFLLLRIDIFWKKKFPKSYSAAIFSLDRNITFAIGFILYLYISADFYGRFTKNEIENKEPITIRFEDNEVKSGKLIGKTKDILFLLKNDGVEAIPITSVVKEIKIK